MENLSIGIWSIMNKSLLPNLNNCSVAVIGLGYVGLPLALKISENNNCLLTNSQIRRKVIGYDFDLNRIRQLEKGIDRNKVFKKEDLKNNTSLKYTNDINLLKDVDVFIVTVPTPINNENEPDLYFIKSASETVGKSINFQNTKNDNQIIIYESTVYPGLTEDICVPILEKYSDKKFNKLDYKRTFYCGYSPERINPGDGKNTLESIVKVTSGSNEIIANWVDSFYGSFIKAGTFKAKSIKVAEAAKVIENTQRDINIALVNELSILFNKLNINTNDVLNAAGTKWNFHKYKPGLVGGHCIGVDPYYLAYKANEIGFNTKLISAGRNINDFMHEYLFKQILLKIGYRKKIFEKESVLILGVTYKENSADMRHSQIINLLENLENNNMEITVVDPLVDPELFFSITGINVHKYIPNKKKYSIIIFALAHNEFENIKKNKIEKLSYQETIVFDLTNKLNGENIFHL